MRELWMRARVEVDFLRLRARIAWRRWRLERGWIPVNGLRPGENVYARMRALFKR